MCLKIDRLSARRFALKATGITQPFSGVGDALQQLGFIQIDPINVCGRMHEHICRNRINGYQLEDLHRSLHGIVETAAYRTPTLDGKARRALEHFHPGRGVLAAFPVEAWPHLQQLMHRRSRTPGQWGGKLTTDETHLAKWILQEIETQGAMGSEHLEHEGSSHNGWSRSRTVKVVMDKLFAHGRLLISRRLKGRRIYDLPDRLLPASILSMSRPTPLQTKRWLADLKLRQHRLATLTQEELLCVKKQVIPLQVEGCAPLFMLKSDEPLLQSVMDRIGDTTPEEAILLAPLDPIILDRTVTSRLWDFDYTWEVYTPATKRTRGYYALPILHHNEFIGHVDLKMDRKKGTLHLLSLKCPNTLSIEPALEKLTRFLQLQRLK